MSKESRRTDQAAAETAAREEALTRAFLLEQEERHQAESAAMRQQFEQALAEERNLRAQQRLEAQAEALELYRQQAIAQATSAKTLAPQFVPFITGSSKEEIDAKIAQAKASTAEILTEVTPAEQPAAQPRHELGRFASAPQPQELTAEQIKAMPWEEYAALRQQASMDQRGIERVGRTPGRGKQSFRGHSLAEGSGFPSWQDFGSNERVYQSQLPDNRR
jgi:hypothetical protein